MRPSQFRFPEGHHLHQALGTDAGNGEAIEMAFGMDQGQHHVRLQAGFAGFAVHQAQQRQALRCIRYVARETRRHVQQPDFGIETVLEAVRFGDGALQ